MEDEKDQVVWLFLGLIVIWALCLTGLSWGLYSLGYHNGKKDVVKRINQAYYRCTNQGGCNEKN